MIMTRSRSKDKVKLNIFAIFIYATLIVDFYRKFVGNVAYLPISVTAFRNLIYVSVFLALLFYEKRKMYQSKLVLIGIAFCAFSIFSLLINWERNATELYIDLMFMFISRLLPAYYIGTMIVGNEEKIVDSINRLQWLTLLYELMILIYPEVSATSYLTISANLIIPSLVGTFAESKGLKGIAQKSIGIIGLGVIVVFGGRTSVVAVVLAIGLILFIKFKNNNSKKKIVALFGVLSAVIFLAFSSESILDYLVLHNPESRTLHLILSGRFFWSSNRDLYYNAAVSSFTHHPFKIYGFLGDRFYYADYFSRSKDNSVIVTMFSHNAIIEIMMNFGIFIGILINLYLIYKFTASVKFLIRRNDQTAWMLHLIIFSSAFVALFISSSWLNDYTVWLMCGAALKMASQSNRLVFRGGGTNVDF